MARERKIDMVILGLLSHEDLTGYDIKKRIDGAISFFWKGSFGNIYPALKDMEASGMIQKKAAAEGGRGKISYHITSTGKKVLKEWLKEEQVVNELKYETLLKLFFGGNVGKAVAIRNIEAFEKKIEKELMILKKYCETLKDKLSEEDHLYFYLTASFGVKSYEAYLEWCQEAKQLLG